MKVLTFFAGVIVVGCISSPKKDTVYVYSLGGLRAQIAIQSATSALKLYEKQMQFALDDPRQSFLHQLNLGSLSLLAAEYPKSRNHFQQAAQYIDWQNYTSVVSEVSKVVLLSPTQERYRLAPQEYLMINFMVALSSALEKDWANALVGIRALHQNLNRMKGSEFSERVPSSFAFFYFFAGLVYEMNGLYDDARIDYEVAWQLDPKIPQLGFHLWKSYFKTQFDEQEKRMALLVGVSDMTEAQKRKLIETTGPDFVFYMNLGWENWVYPAAVSPHIERVTKDGEREIWNSSEIYPAFQRSAIDREISEILPKDLDNPAYLIHVNPFSVTTMVFGVIFKSYWELLTADDQQNFIVESWDFIPKVILMDSLSRCETQGARCFFRSYGSDSTDKVRDSGPIKFLFLMDKSQTISK